MAKAHVGKIVQFALDLGVEPRSPVRFRWVWVNVVVIKSNGVSFSAMPLQQLMQVPGRSALSEIVRRMQPMLDRYPEDCRADIVQKWERNRRNYKPCSEGQTLSWLARSARWAVAQHKRARKNNPLNALALDDEFVGRDDELPEDDDQAEVTTVPAPADQNLTLLALDHIDPALGDLARSFLEGGRKFTPEEVEMLQEALGGPAFMK